MSGLKNANFVNTVLQDLLHRDLIVKCNKHLLWLIHNSFYSIKQKIKWYLITISDSVNNKFVNTDIYPKEY
jgi:hypothetical protein